MHALRQPKPFQDQKPNMSKKVHGSKLISTQQVNNIFQVLSRSYKSCSKLSVQSSYAAIRKCTIKQPFWKFSKNSKKNTQWRSPILVKQQNALHYLWWLSVKVTNIFKIAFPHNTCEQLLLKAGELCRL